jgi:hypothetical protein
VWIVAPQEELLIVQLPVPIGGFWSEVKIPPANTAMSVDWAKLRPENKSVQNNAPRILLKMTSQQRLNCWRHYKGQPASTSLRSFPFRYYPGSSCPPRWGSRLE